MFEAVPSPYLVPFDGAFRAADLPSEPPDGAPRKKECKKRLERMIEQLSKLQSMLYAHDRYAVLLVFQAMDAAGKDSTIRAVMSGINPAGCQVFSFKTPSALELDHDFLWRTAVCLPERGRIGIFNRSYYEEVLVVRVHPEFLAAQRLPEPLDIRTLWAHRYESIRDHEKHLARSGTLVIKFWLNVSKDEQRRRFIARIDEADKNWKFSEQDVAERLRWSDYMAAYEQALAATSTPWAPWYAIPADDKPFMRLTVAELIVASLSRLGLEYPRVGLEQKNQFDELRRSLESD